MPSKSFPLFCRFPPEIRCRVWMFAIPTTPRMIELVADSDNMGNMLYSCPRNRQPALLHVNVEARNEFLKHRCLYPERPDGIPRHFDHDNYIIYMGETCYSDLELFQNPPFTDPTGFDPLQLKFLALNSRSWDMHSFVVRRELYMLPQFEELTLVYHWDEDDTDPEGPLMLMKLADDEDMSRRGEDGAYDQVMCSREYKDGVVRAFGEQMVGNPWWENRKAAPRVRMMKRLPKSDHLFDLS